MLDGRELREIYGAEPPFVSIYRDTSGARENAAQVLQLRWKEILRRLEDLDVDVRTRDALTAAQGDPRLGSIRALIAAEGRVRHARSWRGRTDVDIVRVGALPYLVPLLSHEQRAVAHAIVLVDRRGADVLAYGGGPLPDQVAGVDATPYPVHKTGGGGWAAKRYEKTVEENWKKGAKAVCELVADIADGIGAEIIFMAGDVKELTLVLDYLPPAHRARVRQVPGGRSVDGSDVHVADIITRRLDEHLRARDAETLDRFAGGRTAEGGGRSADGPATTVAALREAAVGTLLLTPTAERRRTAWFGSDPLQLALTRQEVRDAGVHEPSAADLVDVAVRAAICSDATVRILPADVEGAPTEGVGAILRHPR